MVGTPGSTAGWMPEWTSKPSVRCCTPCLLQAYKGIPSVQGVQFSAPLWWRLLANKVAYIMLRVHAVCVACHGFLSRLKAYAKYLHTIFNVEDVRYHCNVRHMCASACRRELWGQRLPCEWRQTSEGTSAQEESRLRYPIPAPLPRSVPAFSTGLTVALTSEP